MGVPFRGTCTNTGLDNLTSWPELLALVTQFPWRYAKFAKSLGRQYGRVVNILCLIYQLSGLLISDLEQMLNFSKLLISKIWLINTSTYLLGN